MLGVRMKLLDSWANTIRAREVFELSRNPILKISQLSCLYSNCLDTPFLNLTQFSKISSKENLRADFSIHLTPPRVCNRVIYHRRHRYLETLS